MCLSTYAFAEETIYVDGITSEVSFDEEGAPVTPVYINTIANALAFANDYSTTDSSYSEVVLELSANIRFDEAVTLDTYSNLTKVTINGASRTLTSAESARHFILNTSTPEFVLNSVTLAGNSGGGVSITDGAPTFDGVTFSRINAAENFAEEDQNGGAASITGGTVTFTNCTFTGCAATNGGALYVEGGAVTVSGGTFSGGTSTGTENGGVMYIAGGQVNVSDSSLNGATVSGNGGALYIEGGQATFSGATEFTSNKAANGGAIYFADGTLTFSGTANFEDNRAAASGGAIYTVQDSRGTLRFNSSVTFKENRANEDVDDDGNGGAIWWGMNPITFEDTFTTTDETISFVGNIADGSDATTEDNGNGGAIYLVSSGAFTLTGTKYEFDNNTAHNYGGAIYAKDTAVTLSGVNLSNTGRQNNAIMGGFLYSAASTLTVENSTFRGYRAEYGGAIYYGQENVNGKINVKTSAFFGNTVLYRGGSIYTSSSTVDISDSYFDGNSAGEYGGAVFFDGPGSATLTNDDFKGNQSDSLGGAIYSIVPVYITTSYFDENSAASKGGAVFFQLSGNGIVSVTSSTFYANHADGGQGGALSLEGDEINIEACTFSANRATGGDEAFGGAVYLNVASTTSSKSSSVVNCTFTGNITERGVTSSGGALAVFGKVSVTSCVFTRDNTATTSGGAIYIGNSGSSKQVTIAGCIIVGNSSPLGGDIYSLSDGGKKSGGYNRIGTYGTPNGSGTWEAHGGADTDKESINWTSETFFGNQVLADNILTASIPPHIGSSLTSEDKRLQTLLLDEAEDLLESYRATNAIPYATERYNFPRYDQQGTDRWENQANLDIGAIAFRGTRPGNNENPITTYTIQSVTMSGIPNTLKSVGTTASLIAIVRYSNGRTAYGGDAAGCEPVTWSSSAPAIVAIDSKLGNIIAKAAGQAVITVRTTRTTAGGVQATASRVVRVESIPATYMNTISQQYQNYFATYIEQLSEHDLSLSLTDASASAVKASSFQRNFKAVWPVSTATLVTDLRSSTPTFTTASAYSTSDGLSSSKNAAVTINFQNRNTGDIFPLVYSWNFSGDEVKALLGSDLTGQAANAALAAKLFGALRIDYQTATRTYPVIGSGGVSASEAYQYGALALTKADADRGVHVEITAYLANVAATGSNDGPQIVKGAGTTRLLVVPDGADDGAITGTMWMAQKASTSSTGDTNNNEGSTNTNTNTGGNTSGSEESGGGGGGGCSVFGLGLLGTVVLFMKRR